MKNIIKVAIVIVYKYIKNKQNLTLYEYFVFIKANSCCWLNMMIVYQETNYWID